MMTPIHPNCLLERPLTEEEMLDMIQYEGLVGLGMTEDIETAKQLALRGLVEVTIDPNNDEMVHIINTQGERNAV